MNDRTRFRHPVGARASRVAAACLLALAALGAGSAPSFAAKGGSGSIWTTDAACTVSAAQNQNLYKAGDTVFVRGDNFLAATSVSWTIAGLPGGASADPGVIVASGAVTSDGLGSFCANAYTVAADDAGVYTVDVTQGKTKKNDNYRVEAPVANPPTDNPPTDNPPTDNPPTDSGPTDNPPADSGPTDNPPTDNPPTDSGPTDSGPTDSGPTDNGPTDNPPTDSGPTDSGPTDSGPTDSGPTDNGPTDNGPTDSSVAGISTGGPSNEVPSLSVQGDLGLGSGIELPATDTVSNVATGGSSLLLILGLAGLAGAAVLFAPSRRRKPEATE